MIELRLDLKPTPKRQIIKNNKIENDDKTKSFIKQIRSELQPKKIKLLTGALSMNVSFVYKRTKSQKHFEDHRYPKERRPYLVNLIKSLTESLKGIVYPDSSMICELNAKKLVGKPEESSYIQVCIKRFDPQKSQKPYNNAEGGSHERMSVREKRRKENQRKHREEQAEKHERQSIERELRKQANREAHQTQQEERNKLAKEESRKRSIEKFEAMNKSRAEEKAEKERLEAERRKREHDEFLKRYLPPRRRSDDD